MNSQYISLVDRYFDQLISLVEPLQYNQGGPIIDFQIEDDTDTSIPTDLTQAYYIIVHM